MIDNKPMELEALGAITARISKFSEGMYFLSNPNCDIDGGDFLIYQIDKLGADKNNKIIKCQSKGRDISNNPSNVVIPASYVQSDFLLFLYLRTKDEDMNVYLFTHEDIRNNWSLSNEKYTLNIPVNYPSNKSNSFFLFTRERAQCIIDTLDSLGPSKLKDLEDSMIVEFLLKLWQKSGGLPNYEVVQYIVSNADVMVPFFYTRHLLFLACAITIANEKDDFSLSIDWLFKPLSINTGKLHIKIVNTDNRISRETGYSYRHCITEVSYMNGDTIVSGYHINMHDIEEQIDGYIFRDGLYSVEYTRLH